MSAARRGLAAGALVIPGALLHGSGSWVLGDDETARRLLLLEGAGVGLIAGGLGGLAATGAARALVGTLAVTTMAGVSLFGLTFVADVYRVASPPDGFGVPRRTPFFESRLGWLHVDDPQFAFHDFAHTGFRFQPGRAGLTFQSWHAPLQGNAQLRIEPSYRLWEAAPRGVRPVADGSFLELAIAASQHQFQVEGFASSTYELELRHRLDTARVLPSIRGAFTQFHVGYALRNTRFEDFGASNRDSLLLGGFGFGAYLGSAEVAGGEAVLYYDHRHDGFAAGMKATGLGSGVMGHFGLSAHYYLNERFGLDATAEVGSAWVVGAGLRVRVSRPPADPQSTGPR